MKKCLYALFRLDTSRQKLLLLLGILTIGVFNTLTAQTVYRYTGTVSDVTGVTLPGVNVIEEGTTNGTSTDANGFFMLESVAPKAVLSISFVGYVPQKIEATPGTTLKITLEESVVALKEVMVVGYGTQKKSYITGAISKIDSKELKSIPSARVDQAIQGRIAGVSVLPNSGSPGASLKVRIRGTSTNGNSDPLYIVDGMKTTDISNIEPSDIESIEVLKDGASAAIYGAEAANGVILVTTKSGKSGLGKINYDFQYGIQTPGKLVDVMNAQDWTTWVNEANVGVTIPANPQYNTNWLEEETSTAPMQKHYLSFTGGNEKSSYLLSASYTNQDGIVGKDNSNYDRFTVRLNSDHKVKDWLEVGNNLTISQINREAITEDEEFGGIITDGLLFDPSVPVVYDGALPDFAQNALNSGYTLLQNGNGQYYGLSQFVTGEIANPIAKIALEKGNTKQNKIFGSFYAKFKLYEGLTFTSRLGVDYADQLFHTWYPSYWFSAERNNSTPNVRDNTDTWTTWLWENYANYTKQIGDHNVTALLGISAQRNQHKYLTTLSGPMFIEDETFAQHGATPVDGTVSGNLEDKRLQSYFGRLSYNYKGKYMVDVSVRRDGSSLLAAGKKWGTFPAVSAG